MRNLDIKKLDFEKQGGLIPAVIQDKNTAQVLMLGYMNKEALEKTLEDKKVCFYSRSKERLWTKGESSGNFMIIDSEKDISQDCDNDTLLIQVQAPKAACHTGDYSCFADTKKAKDHSGIIFFNELLSLIEARKKEMPKGSYTTELFERGLNKIAQKVGEEGVEVVIAALSETHERLISESADLLYHLCILWAEKDVKFEEIIQELKRRNK